MARSSVIEYACIDDNRMFMPHEPHACGNRPRSRSKNDLMVAFFCHGVGLALSSLATAVANDTHEERADRHIPSDSGKAVSSQHRGSRPRHQSDTPRGFIYRSQVPVSERPQSLLGRPEERHSGQTPLGHGDSKWPLNRCRSCHRHVLVESGSCARASQTIRFIDSTFNLRLTAFQAFPDSLPTFMPQESILPDARAIFLTDSSITKPYPWQSKSELELQFGPGQRGKNMAKMPRFAGVADVNKYLEDIFTHTTTSIQQDHQDKRQEASRTDQLKQKHLIHIISKPIPLPQKESIYFFLLSSYSSSSSFHLP